MSAFRDKADMTLGSKLRCATLGILLGDSRERDNVVTVGQQIVRIGHARSGSSLRKVVSPVQHDLD